MGVAIPCVVAKAIAQQTKRQNFTTFYISEIIIARIL